MHLAWTSLLNLHLLIDEPVLPRQLRPGLVVACCRIDGRDRYSEGDPGEGHPCPFVDLRHRVGVLAVQATEARLLEWQKGSSRVGRHRVHRRVRLEPPG